MKSTSKIRLGLCCIFVQEPIAFRRTTATYLKKQDRAWQKGRLAELCLHNARALLAALAYCRDNGIGCFRIQSQILPLKTHPEAGFEIAELPGSSEIIAAFKACGSFCRKHRLRTTFHPDQFIVLSSPDPGIVKRSVAELMYQAEVSTWVGADVITLHAGGAYGDKKAALARLVKAIRGLPRAVRLRLALENDDRVFTPADLLPVCREARLPFVYDAHHHRCLPDSQTIESVTAQALATWNREPLFHISSPLRGWGQGSERSHHDYLNPADFPACWLSLPVPVTVEIEAKAKELAIKKLLQDMPHLALRLATPANL